MLTADDPLPLHPTRVAVAGVSGVGKTTLAGRIAGIIGAPHTEIDSLYHGPGWTPRPEFLADVAELLAGERWVTEFQYRLARPMIAERMELLVWLDLPYWRTNFPRVVARTVRRRILREEMWNGNLEGPLWRVLTDREHIVRWSVAHRNSQRGSLPGLAASKGWTVVRLRSQAEVERWLRGPLTAAADR